MFHIIYSRHNLDNSDSWTVFRNCEYSSLMDMMKLDLVQMAKECDEKYEKYLENTYSTQERELWSKDNNFVKSECYFVDDEDYYKTYKSAYGDAWLPMGKVNPDADYVNNFGQISDFMLKKDFEQREAA